MTEATGAPAAGDETTGAPAPGEQEPGSIADGVDRPLDPRYVDLQKVVGWIATACVCVPLLGGCLVLAVVPDPPAWLKALAFVGWAAVTGGLAWLGQRWPGIEHRHARYRVDGQGIEIREGVVWRKVVSVPRSRVQHTDVAQGPMERAWGLGTLNVYTAGTEHSLVTLHGLDHETAQRIRDHLLAGGPDDAV